MATFQNVVEAYLIPDKCSYFICRFAYRKDDCMLNERVYREHYETILHMYRNLGIDSTDDFLCQELSNASKAVATLREKILEMKSYLDKKTNTDELRHLQYDLEDSQLLLEDLLQKLRSTDERYLCFKEYLRRYPKEV